MEKMRMESTDLTAQNIEKIGALFPNCITETVDENGIPKKAINFNKVIFLHLLLLNFQKANFQGHLMAFHFQEVAFGDFVKYSLPFDTHL